MVQSHDRTSGSLADSSVIDVERGLRLDVATALPTVPADPHRPDPLSDVLRMVKLTGALFFIIDATSPWGVEIPRAERFAPILLPRAQHVVSYHIGLEGHGWVTSPEGDPVRFEAGDILVYPHGDAYSMLSAPGQTPEFDCEATIQFFRDMVAGKLPFVVTEGGGGPQQTRFVAAISAAICGHSILFCRRCRDSCTSSAGRRARRTCSAVSST